MSISAGISAIVPNVYSTDSASFAADRYLSADFSAVYAAISLINAFPYFCDLIIPTPETCRNAAKLLGFFRHISRRAALEKTIYAGMCSFSASFARRADSRWNNYLFHIFLHGWLWFRNKNCLSLLFSPPPEHLLIPSNYFSCCRCELQHLKVPIRLQAPKYANLTKHQSSVRLAERYILLECHRWKADLTAFLKSQLFAARQNICCQRSAQVIMMLQPPIDAGNNFLRL